MVFLAFKPHGGGEFILTEGMEIPPGAPKIVRLFVRLMVFLAFKPTGEVSLS
jgi:hypothetical protein